MTDQGPAPAVLLERAAIRVSRDHAFVGATFRAWCGSELDLEAVSVNLGCPREAAVRAALCRRPRAEAFRSDAAGIAASCGINEPRLISLLREGASVEAFRRGPAQQMLAAARDAPDEPEEPK